jgi:hypothetical protein
MLTALMTLGMTIGGQSDHDHHFAEKTGALELERRTHADQQPVHECAAPRPGRKQVPEPLEAHTLIG